MTTGAGAQAARERCWPASYLSTALVSGGWLVERGLLGGTQLADDTNRARMFRRVYRHVARDFVDTLADSTLVYAPWTG